jgi:hypothetical protein
MYLKTFFPFLGGHFITKLYLHLFNQHLIPDFKTPNTTYFKKICFHFSKMSNFIFKKNLLRKPIIPKASKYRKMPLLKSLQKLTSHRLFEIA